MMDDFQHETSNREFLLWLADRLEKVYGEAAESEVVLRLRALAEQLGR